MTTWVKFGRGTKWHLVSVKWHYRPITHCDRKINDKAVYADHAPADRETICLNCRDGVVWEDFAPERVAVPERRYVLARPASLPPIKPVKLGKRCAHLWQPSPFDSRYARCALCGLHANDRPRSA